MSTEKPVYDEESGGGRGAEAEKGRKFFEMGTSSNSRSFEVESWAFVPHQNYSLQLMQRVTPQVEGDVVPATVPEMLAFFRIYTSTVAASQLLPLVILHFNSFVWYCVFNFIIKSLPLNYMTLFLSSYVPHEPMVIDKMVPLMYGYNVLMIVAILTNFSFVTDPMLMMLYYAYNGVSNNVPWAREAVYVDDRNRTVNCLPIDKFCDVAKMPGAKFLLFSPYLLGPNRSSVHYTAPPLIFFSRSTKFCCKYDSDSAQIRTAVIISIFLAIIGICRKQIYKRTIWQVTNYSNWMLISFYLGAMIHILIFSLETTIVDLPNPLAGLRSAFKFLDYELLADALGSPPVLHFLASKSNHQINPAEDSAILVLSNSLHYIIRGVVLRMLQRYSEHVYKVTFLTVTVYNMSFLYWPLYLSLVPFGDFLGCAFFLVQGITEFLSLVISYNIGLECIQCAFPKLKWWLMLVVTMPYVVLFRIKITQFRGVFRTTTHAMVKGSVALAEMLIIVCLYPIARLEDDITFHTGSPPPKVISYAIRFAPAYVAVKLYFIIGKVYEVALMSNDSVLKNLIFRWILVIIGILLIGILYPVIKNLCIKKQNWRSLFRPVPQWGPKDHIQRQLRKQFDSREYIGSTASRYLSRYLKSKLTSRMYRLDACYEADRGRRQSTIAPQYDSFRYDDETKKDV